MALASYPGITSLMGKVLTSINDIKWIITGKYVFFLYSKFR
jgi:hypothetical protein